MTDGLAILRTIFLSVVSSTLVLGVVVVVMSSAGAFGDPAIDLLLGIGMVAATGVSTGIVSSVASPGLDCSTPRRLADTFRTRVIVRLALAEATMIVAFVSAVLTAQPLVYLAGAPFAAYDFVRIAPTRTRLERDQEELRMHGCGTSLIDALRGGIPPG